MCHKYVVEKHDVAFLPWESDFQPAIYVQYFAHYGLLDWRAISVITIPGVIVFVEERGNGFARRRIEAGKMPMLRLIEPRPFAGCFMLHARRAYRTGLQTAVGFPFELNQALPAQCFHPGRLVRLKDCLPVKPHAGSIVTGIHHTLFHKAVTNSRRDVLETPTAIHDRCFSPPFRRLHTAK